MGNCWLRPVGGSDGGWYRLTASQLLAAVCILLLTRPSWLPLAPPPALALLPCPPACRPLQAR